MSISNGNSKKGHLHRARIKLENTKLNRAHTGTELSRMRLRRADLRPVMWHAPKSGSRMAATALDQREIAWASQCISKGMYQPGSIAALHPNLLKTLQKSSSRRLHRQSGFV